MSDPFFPVLALFFFAGTVVLGLLLIAQTAGPKNPNPVKAEPFESGNPPKGDARIRFPVKFYLVAMLFLIFDLEAVFLYPWAVMFRRLGIFGLVEMGIFLLIAAIGFIYAWKKGALDLE
jgi:NADH-quinone oxidoreductase subunit A